MNNWDNWDSLTTQYYCGSQRLKWVAIFINNYNICGKSVMSNKLLIRKPGRPQKITSPINVKIIC